MKDIRYLSVEEAIAINIAMIQRYSPSEQKGVKEAGLLESAVLRPQSSAFEKDAYPTIFEKSAALFESLGQNHPFYNANKRTAFTALVLFLRYNGLHLTMDTNYAEDFVVNMVNHKYTFEELTQIIQKHCVAI